VSAPATIAYAVRWLTASISRRSNDPASGIERGSHEAPPSVERRTVPPVPEAQIAPSAATLKPRSEAVDGDSAVGATWASSGDANANRRRANVVAV